MATEIIFTALPNGRTGNRLHLSVHVSPRLTTGGADVTLADFPEFLSWPPSDLSFQVEFTNAAASYRGLLVSSPTASLWEQLFPSSSLVRSHAPADHSQTPIHSYPVTKIVQFLADQYADVALNSPEEFPAIADLLANGFDAIRFSGRDGAEKFNTVLADLQALLGGSKAVDTRAASSPTFDFVQLEDFFAPVDIPDRATEEKLKEPVTLPTLDFHEAIQFCNHHPALLRALGLVLDLDVDLDSQAVPPSGPTQVRVIPAAGALSTATLRTPRTHCTVGPAAFTALPGPAGTHLAAGFLRFDDPAQFETIQVEPDGAGLKAVDFAGNLRRRQLHPTEGAPTDSSLPSLRADGFAVARKGAAQQLHDRLAQGPGREADLGTDKLELWAEDIVRGVRVDVWDSRSQAWNSLMQRIGEYKLAQGQTVLPVTDEGVLGTAATRKPLSDDLYLPEEVFAWDGWSLVVPRPGQTLNTDPQGDPLIEVPPNAPTDFDAAFQFSIRPGSLPQLRYGSDYRFRARTVDLAGNSLPPDSTNAAHASPPRTFGRFEPAAAPPVLLRTPRGPGESAETIVLRSNFDVPPPVPTAERHIAPAKVGQLMVELHGELDVVDPNDPTTIVLDKGAYQLLADRDDGNLLNHPDGLQDPNDPVDTRYYDVAQLTTTWTPDPATRAFALRLLDGPHAGFAEVYSLVDPASDGSWSDMLPVRMVVEHASGPPTFDASTRVLTVPMDKADVVHARLSAVLDVGDLPGFGLWQWILDKGPSPFKEQQLMDLVRRGQHWMFEPYRILTLVHAVRQPLLPPEFPVIGASRSLGDTWARISGLLHFSRKSTSKVDVLASWHEPVDQGPGTPDPVDVGEPGSLLVDRATAFVLDIEQDEGPAEEQQLRHRHEFGDTRHRMVTYRGVATTRFGEFFTDRDEFPYDPDVVSVTLPTGGLGVVPGSVKLSRRQPDQPLVEDVHFSVDEATGTITFLAELEDLDPAPQQGDPMVAVFLVPPVARETPDPPAPPEIGPQLVNVPSSARPSAPRVLYAVPTFGWESGELEGNGEVVGLTSTRRGNGLRVYLERPWWTSGEGELLGVVTWPRAEEPDPPDLEDPQDPSKDADPRRPYVSQWGQDPIFGSPGLVHRYPRLASLPDAVETNGTTLVTLEELDSSITHPVNVAGHVVGFDTERKLWFCDITLAPGAAYSPIVRLALARYQPSSLPHAHLSRVVLADFVQLAPNRFATVAFDDADDSIMVVSLSGPTHVSTEASDGSDPGPAHVIVEQRDPTIQGDLAWQPVGEPIEMNGSLANGQGQWFTEVHLPGPKTPGTWRLVIEQFELLGEEPMSKPQQSNPFLRTQPIPTKRLVHTDIIEL